jgi:copper chaperone CopZ
MTCHHCAKAVEEELGALPGVQGVAVELVPDGLSQVTVTSAAPLDREAVEGAIVEAGYVLAAQ